MLERTTPITDKAQFVFAKIHCFSVKSTNFFYEEKTISARFKSNVINAIH